MYSVLHFALYATPTCQQLAKIREHGILERRILTVIAARASAASSQVAALTAGEHERGGRVPNRGQNGAVGGGQRQVGMKRELGFSEDHARTASAQCALPFV